MIQELTANYWTDILVGYVKGGIVGWAVWFAASFVYVLVSFGTNMALYRTEGKGGGKWTFHEVMEIILWPYGILHLTHKLVKLVEKRLSGKE